MATNLFLMACCAAAILWSRKLYRDIFTPLAIYVSVWTLCLLLFRLRLVNYYELEAKAVVLIGGSIVAFVVGCLAAGRPSHRREGRYLLKTFSLKSLEFAIKILLVLNLVGTVIFANRMNTMYGLATYLNDPGVIRKDYEEWTHLGAVGLLTMLDYPLLSCSVIHLLWTRNWRWFTIFTLLLVSFQTILRTDRGSLTYYSITCIALWIYWNGWNVLDWKMVRRLGIVATLLVGYFLGVGFFYGKLASLDNGVLEARDLSMTSEVAVALASPYIYATSPIGGFQPAIQDVNRLSWGTHTFFPVARVLSGLGVIEAAPDPYNFDYYMVPIPVNTYTHLYTFYQDFGVAGVFLIPMMLGYLETRLYLRMKACPTLFALGACAALLALNVFSVFIPLITGVPYWYYFMVLFAVSMFCRLPEHEAGSVRTGVFLGAT